MSAEEMIRTKQPLSSCSYAGLLEQTAERIDWPELAGKTVLITGATGMLGSCLVDMLMCWNRHTQTPCAVAAVGRNRIRAQARFGYLQGEPGFHYYAQDVCAAPHDLPARVDYIIHAAGNADPRNFKDHPVETVLANIAGTQRMLEYGKEHGMTRFLYLSSGEFYGQPDGDDQDFRENYCGPVDYADARCCYPAGKRGGEALCQAHKSQYGTDIVIVRPCHVFGPTMTASDSRAVSEFLWSAAERRDIVMRSSGEMERSHCFVTDAARAILTVLARGTSGEAYNIADPKYQMTIRDFAAAAAQAGGCRLTVDIPAASEQTGYSKVRRAVLCVDKLESLDWAPDERITSAIAETVGILREGMLCR